MKEKELKNDLNKGFWSKLKKPFFVLAPMANVTDCVFRKLFAKYGKPDVTWTEFVSADGLLSKGKSKLLIDLKYSNKERPIVAQLFTGHPEQMEKACRLVAGLGFDGIDINMGCPDRAVEKQGGGASLIKNKDLAIQIIQAARDGVLSAYKKRGVKNFPKSIIPISVKTRIGYNKVDFDWIKTLLEQKLPVLTVHLRTRKEMSNCDAHWELMPEIVKLRNEICKDTLIIGNGDVTSMTDAKEKIAKYGCDGVMVGRGIFGKPWFFTDVSHPETTDISFRLGVLVEHTKAFEKEFKNIKSFDIMKKHFKAYVNGFDGAKELRVELMGAKSAKEVSQIIKRFLSTDVTHP